ncbi:autotransporter-associated beta strand repeat-containing protein [Verrucomicrobium sp. BvORR034]|uniref:beta strand repeat-containing protein n=1 Tax=Verrucomicrobium sp. BvORR034 TaxID=1396418 RepID=UPI0006799FBE|nr:autotransporter-associated beta strand repeat-containing protein [Verrucomicrobium sp. BvORR034]
MRHITFVFFPLLVCTFLTLPSLAQTLTFDGVPIPVNSGTQNGGGDWNTTALNWYDLTLNQNVSWNNDGAHDAAFGNTNSVTGGTINLTENIFVRNMRFNSLQAGPTIAGGMTHTFSSTNGSALNFADGAIITAAENSSSGSGTILFINFNLAVKAHNLTMARDSGTLSATFQYLRFANDNDLTGTLTLQSSPDFTKGIFLLTAGNNNLEGLDKVVVQAGSVLATSGTGQTYVTDIHLAGNGVGNGAIRVDSANITYTGDIVLTADAGIMTNASAGNAVISGGISEQGGSYGFARFASAVDTTLTITGVNTYTGKTTFGRSNSVAGGITILDFNGAGAPEDDILYNNVASAGMLELIGGTYGRAALVLQGKDGVANSQRFGNLSATGTRSTVSLISGTGGTMDLSLGTISRVQASTTLAFITPTSGTISTTQANGLIGPWATIADASGNGGWAQASNGVVTRFTGTTTHTLGSTLNTYTATTDLQLTNASRAVATASGSAMVASISQTDTVSKRLLDIGTGNQLQLGQTAGIQMTGGAKDLIVGRAGSAGKLTAGTATGASLFLTNMSPSATLTIHSQIVNNAAGPVNLYINGSGNVVLDGDNTFTGSVQIASGSLEIRHPGALGTTAGSTSVLAGAALRLSGGVSSAEAISIAGNGVNNDGALRSVGGSNMLTGPLTLAGPGRINVDTGTLTLQGATLATNVITVSSTSNTLTFGGAGTLVVNGRINSSTGTAFTKDGSGLMIVNGDNAFTTATAVSNGILRIGHVNALGTAAGATTVSGTGAVELNGNGWSLAETFTLGSTGTSQGGGLRSTGGDNSLTGLITVNNASRIQSLDGTLTLDVASGSAIIKDNSSTNRALAFGGAGNILVLDAISRQSTGIFSITKDGSGTLTLRAASNYDGTTTLSGGELYLDFADAGVSTNLIYNGLSTPGGLTITGSTLRVTGRSGTTTSQQFGNLAIGVGQSYITTVQNGATAVNISFGNIARALSGSVLEFTPPPAGSYSTTGGVNNALITHDGTASVTWGKNDWAATTAAVDGRRQIVGLSSIVDGYTASTSTSLSGNADVVLGAGIITLAASADTSSLRFNAAQSSYIGMSDGITLTTGGILVGEGVGAHTTYIDGGTLRSNSTGLSFTTSDLVIVQNNTLGDLIITANIDNNLGGTNTSTSLTKSGAGTVILDTATHNYSGTTKVIEGTLHLRTGNINTAGQYTLGGGATSGKFKIGNNTTSILVYSDWLQIDGYGTQNALVGGGTVLSTFLLDGSNITSDFRKGYIGGAGQYENNISIRMAADNAPLILGANNTYAGKTTISFGLIEVEKLADLGQVSSLGTGTFNGTGLTADSGIIDLSNRTTGSTGLNAYSVLRYIGSTDSSTNRVVRISNTDLPNEIISVVAVLENNGTGTVKFTSAMQAAGSNPVERLLRLSGTNTGANSIVSINNPSATILTRIEKTGTGTWAITGASTHGGGTDILAGTLLAMNTGGSPGSATGSGNVTVAAGATLGGIGRVAPGTGSNITVNGTVAVGDSTLAIAQAARLEIATTGSGTLTFKSGSSLALDLIHGQMLGNNAGDSTAADVMVINGSLVIENGATLIINNPMDMMEWAVNDSWKLFDWSGLGSRTGEFSILALPGLSGDLSWDTSKLYTEGVISVTNVPEPGRTVLLMVALAVGVMRRRRRF